MAVSNTFTSVIPTLYAQGLNALRRNSVMPRLVMNDFSADVAKKGEVVQIPLPSAITTQAVVPAAYAPDPGNVAPTTAPIALDSWYEAPFTLSEKELAQVIDGIVPIQLSAAVEALADQINQSIFALNSSVYGFVGTPGTTPFASDVTAATNAGAVLTNQLAPRSDRSIVLNPTAYGTALALPTFYGALYNGGTDMVSDGLIKRKFGFDWAEDQRVPYHTSGTITTGLTAQASTGQPVGTTAVVATTAASTGACALLVGDIITFSGDTQTYVLTANATQASAATNVTLNISPAKQVALVGGETITVKASHVVNLAFHKQAFAFASRPLAQDNAAEMLGLPPAEMTYMIPDPVSGISMRMCVRNEFKRTRFSFECLWGVGAVRPALAARIAG